MANIWIDGDYELGTVGFLLAALNLSTGIERAMLWARPLHSNDGETLLRGSRRAYGSYDTAMGLARVSRIASNGRVCLTRIERGSAVERAALEELGWPELAS